MAAKCFMFAILAFQFGAALAAEPGANSTDIYVSQEENGITVASETMEASPGPDAALSAGPELLLQAGDSKVLSQASAELQERWNVTKSKGPQVPRLRGASWCNANGPSKDWAEFNSCQTTPFEVKALTYNLFWWNLFGLRNGNSDSAGQLIRAAGQDRPHDVMGFQECDDVQRVLAQDGLNADYTGIQGPHALAAAYRTNDWELLSTGGQDVAEDAPTQWYGPRAALWMRLRNRLSEQTLFFVNHHGPLPVSSGGLCGGTATAFNILAVIAANYVPGDAIIVVGDFNSATDTDVVKELSVHLNKVTSGVAFGGIDHVFSSCSKVLTTRNLGSGGSDHDALDVLLQL